MGEANPFEGDLIRLRAREPDDEPQLYEWFNDPEVTQFLSLRYPVSHAQERDFLARAGGISFGHASFAIETLTDSRMIGGCDLVDASAENRSATLGIAIGDKAYWDSGYGTDAMRTVCRFGFEMMNLNRIQLDVFAPNARAKRVYEKVGFRTEAVRREAVYLQGAYVDVHVMGLLAGELR
jgi:RimJ/RimL family protein N-acetyltransferase